MGWDPTPGSVGPTNLSIVGGSRPPGPRALSASGGDALIDGGRRDAAPALTLEIRWGRDHQHHDRNSGDRGNTQNLSVTCWICVFGPRSQGGLSGINAHNDARSSSMRTLWRQTENAIPLHDPKSKCLEILVAILDRLLMATESGGRKWQVCGSGASFWSLQKVAPEARCIRLPRSAATRPGADLPGSSPSRLALRTTATRLTALTGCPPGPAAAPPCR